MENPETLTIVIAVLQPVAIGLVGWLLVKMNSLNREVGVLLNKIENIISNMEASETAVRRKFDEKQDKDRT